LYQNIKLVMLSSFLYQLMKAVPGGVIDVAWTFNMYIVFCTCFCEGIFFICLCLLNLNFFLWEILLYMNYPNHLAPFHSTFLFHKKFWQHLNSNQMKAMNLKMKPRRPYLGTIGSLVFMLKEDMVIEVNSFCPRVVLYKFDILTRSLV